MIKGIEHIGIAVTELEKALKLYRDALGLQAGEIEEHAGMRLGFVKVGQTKVELLEPIDPGGPIAKFIAKRGAGIHHICLETDDIEGDLRRLADAGFELIDKEPRPGRGDQRIAFLHPGSADGTLIELLQQF
jgi:methylmalonyl-CoA/ethylmalonyl-CoA epimerase